MPSEGPRHANHVWDFSHFCAKIFNKSTLREEKDLFLFNFRPLRCGKHRIIHGSSSEGACFCWATSISQALSPKGFIASCNQGHHPGTKCSNTWAHCVCGGRGYISDSNYTNKSVPTMKWSVCTLKSARLVAPLQVSTVQCILHCKGFRFWLFKGPRRPGNTEQRPGRLGILKLIQEGLHHHSANKKKRCPVGQFVGQIRAWQ